MYKEHQRGTPPPPLPPYPPESKYHAGWLDKPTPDTRVISPSNFGVLDCPKNSQKKFASFRVACYNIDTSKRGRMNKHEHNDDGTTVIFIESKTHGNKEAIIDTEDWDRVKAYNWSLSTPKKNGNCYAKTQINHPDGDWIPCKTDGRRRRKTVLQMHHLILGKPAKKKQTDHIDGNGLNNCKSNLRHVTPAENSWNTIHKNKTGYKGVRKYKVEVYKYGCKLGGKHVASWFDTPKEAAIAYDRAVIRERSIVNAERQLNFPERYEEYMAELTNA
tara:strand:- start:415 stop:1236 length:822 start_codon:yes stop_codon:yes gene_type:complete